MNDIAWRTAITFNVVQARVREMMTLPECVMVIDPVTSIALSKMCSRVVGGTR